MILLVFSIALCVAVFFYSRRRAFMLAKATRLPCLPGYYGWYSVAILIVPVVFISLCWYLFKDIIVDILTVNQITIRLPNDQIDIALGRAHATLAGVASFATDTSPTNIDTFVAQYVAAYQVNNTRAHTLFIIVQIALVVTLLLLGYMKVSNRFHAQAAFESILTLLCFMCASIALLTTMGIIVSLLFETIQFFGLVSIVDFLFGTRWEPQNSGFGDVALSSSFGAIPVFLGTILISCIALSLSIPVGLTIAIYMAEYLPRRIRSYCKPVLEILAGIPTVVYGFFAILIVAPSLRMLGESVGLDIVTESALAAGLAMGLMLIPFMSSLSDDVISAVPRNLRHASFAMGATRRETILKVIVPAALPGIVASFLLAASRAIGETMIVVMAAGLAAKMAFNPLDSVTTVTVQMVQMLVGDQEFDSAKTLSAFALGMSLFIATLLLNSASLIIVNKYRERYE